MSGQITSNNKVYMKRDDIYIDIFIYLLPIYLHHVIKFNTTFLENRERCTIKTFLGGSNFFDYYEEIKIGQGIKNLGPKNPRWCQNHKINNHLKQFGRLKEI